MPVSSAIRLARSQPADISEQSEQSTDQSEQSTDRTQQSNRPDQSTVPQLSQQLATPRRATVYPPPHPPPSAQGR